MSLSRYRDQTKPRKSWLVGTIYSEDAARWREYGFNSCPVFHIHLRRSVEAQKSFEGWSSF